MGFGTVGVILVLFLLLAAVWMYGQFVWTFTRWDLADVRLKPFQPAAEFILLGAFASGFCVGLWYFSGQAWKKPQNARTRSKPRTR